MRDAAWKARNIHEPRVMALLDRPTLRARRRRRLDTARGQRRAVKLGRRWLKTMGGKESVVAQIHSAVADYRREA
ncbi:MAG TPA: hypothetical protein VF244_11030 [Acidimicrobiales bacterium]